MYGIRDYWQEQATISTFYLGNLALYYTLGAMSPTPSTSFYCGVGRLITMEK